MIFSRGHHAAKGLCSPSINDSLALFDGHLSGDRPYAVGVGNIKEGLWASIGEPSIQVVHLVVVRDIGLHNLMVLGDLVLCKTDESAACSSAEEAVVVAIAFGHDVL